MRRRHLTPLPTDGIDTAGRAIHLWACGPVCRARVEDILNAKYGGCPPKAQRRDGDRDVTVTKNVAPKSETEPRGAMTRGEIRETPRKKAPPDQPQGGDLRADQAPTEEEMDLRKAQRAIYERDPYRVSRGGGHRRMSVAIPTTIEVRVHT